MGYFWMLFWLRLKSSLRSAAFLVTTFFFLALTVVMAVVLPQGPQTSLRVGLLPVGEAPRSAAELLEEDEDGYRFERYGDRALLERDVLSGKLHCGYLLEEGGEVTALATDASYMRPLIDELVLTAVMEVNAPVIARDFLEQNGLDASGATERFRQLAESEPPMTVRVRELGGGGDLSELAGSGVRPLAYAVFISAFVAAALLNALLAPRGRKAALRQLAVLAGRPAATALAPVAADLALNGAVLLCADACLGLLAGNSGFPPAARLWMLAALAAFTALLAVAASGLRRLSGPLLALIPPLVLISVFCSGALVDPARLPFGLGILRFLSPAWYGLRLMALF